MSQKSKKTALAVRLPTGAKRTHGGFTFLSTGRLPEHRREVERYLTGTRAALVRDLGPLEENLTAARVILIDRAIGKLGLLRCVEEHVREFGVFNGHELAPSLKASYLSYSNSLRLDLQALGLDRKPGAELTFEQIVAEEEAAAGKGQGVQARKEDGGQASGEGVEPRSAREGDADRGGEVR